MTKPWKLLRFRSLLRALRLGLGALPASNITTGVAALGDTCGLTGATAQVVELGATHVAAAHDLDLVDDRRIKREDALDAFAERNLADGEAGADALVRAGDAHAFERLDAGAVAFDDLHADTERVTGAEFGDLLLGGQCFNGLALEGLDQVHF